jgi:hypothetical protein
MKSKTTKTKRAYTTTNIDRESLEKLHEIASREGRSAAKQVAIIIDEYAVMQRRKIRN